MARTGPPDRSDSLPDQPWEVEVTILGEQVRRRAAARVVSAIALLVLVTGALIAGGVLHSDDGGAKPAVAVVQRANVALARIAAVYRYPLGCLGARIVTRHPAPSLPPIDHADPCWRYGVYVTAILRRSGGAWRLALEAISASCPVVSLPLLVRAQLAVCRRPMGAGP